MVVVGALYSLYCQQTKQKQNRLFFVLAEERKKQRADHNEHEHDSGIGHSCERASTGARLANIELAADILYFTSMTGNHERAGDMVN